MRQRESSQFQGPGRAIAAASLLAVVSLARPGFAEPPAPVQAPEATPDTKTMQKATPAPSLGSTMNADAVPGSADSRGLGCKGDVLVVAAEYADMATKMELPDGSVAAGKHTCFVCPAGSFCAVGTKTPGKQVGVYIGGQLAAVDEPPTPAEICDHCQKATLPNGGQSEDDELLTCEAHGETRVPWFVAVAGKPVPARSVIEAKVLSEATQVLKHGAPAQRASFTIDVSGIVREGSSLGSIGTGVGIVSMTRSVLPANLLEAPQPNDTSRLGLGLRYDVALFAQDWLHRLSVVAEYDFLRTPDVSAALGAALGLGASFENGPNSTIQAGMLVGGTAHLDWQVAWQIATVFGVSAQAIILNGKAVELYSGYLGPRVGF